MIGKWTPIGMKLEIAKTSTCGPRTRLTKKDKMILEKSIFHKV